VVTASLRRHCATCSTWKFRNEHHPPSPLNLTHPTETPRRWTVRGVRRIVIDLPLREVQAAKIQDHIRSAASGDHEAMG
jgi:hypothetical protein